MRRNKVSLKSKLAKNELTLGSWITIGHEIVAELLAQRNFDWLTVDMEHSSITLDIAQRLIRVIDQYGVAPLVRVGENSNYLIKRVMDAWAVGVIIPNVKNVEDAKKAVKSINYPPVGFRGVGLARAQGYGFHFDKYKDFNQKNGIVIVQIEDIKGMENLHEILSVEGIDASMIGPYDLSASLSMPGDIYNPLVLQQIEKYLIVCNELNKPAGIHVIPPEIKELVQRREQGFSFLAFSLDTLFLGKKIDDELGEL